MKHVWHTPPQLVREAPAEPEDARTGGMVRRQVTLFRALRSARRDIRRYPRLSAVRSLQELCDVVAEEINKPIQLYFVPLPPELEISALGLPGRERDTIIVGSSSRYHEDHKAAHELWHLLKGDAAQCDDAHPQQAELDLIRLLLPDFEIDSVQKVLKRSNYAHPVEVEAESAATLLSPRMASGSDTTGTRHMASALAHRRPGD